MKILKELLLEKEITVKKITELLVLKVGCLTYSAVNDSPDDESLEKEEGLFNVDLDDENFDPASLITCMETVLRKHPNVFDLTVKNVDDIWLMGSDEHNLVSGAEISIKIDVPQRFQKYSEYGKDKVIEKFDVISRGSSFMAYANVQDIGTNTHIAHEYREIFRNQINKHSNIFSNVLGPCPIHPDIYMAFIEPEDDELSDINLIELEHGDLLILVNNKLNKEETINETLDFIDYQLLELYNLFAIRSELFDFNNNISNLFTELASNIYERSNTKWYKFKKIRKHSRIAKNNLSLCHMLFIQFDDLAMRHSKLRKSFLSDLEENTILSCFEDYITEHTENDTALPASLQSSLSHFEKEIHLFSNLNVIFIASVVGALIGSLLTSIFSLIAQGE